MMPNRSVLIVEESEGISSRLIVEDDAKPHCYVCERVPRRGTAFNSEGTSFRDGFLNFSHFWTTFFYFFTQSLFVV